MKPNDVISMRGAESKFYDIPDFLADHVITPRQARLSPYRGIGAAYTGFAAEAFMDEMSQAAGRDPLELRLDLVANNPRGRHLLEKVAEMSGWQNRGNRAMGLAFAGYHSSQAAGVVEIDLDRDLADPYGLAERHDARPVDPVHLRHGCGRGLMAPAWQAVVPQLVPREKLKPAIALNSMGINISRAIGPALAGVLIASVGLSAPFALNAASHLIIIAALFFWTPPVVAKQSYHGPILSDMATGLRHVRQNAALKATAYRAMAFFLFASAYWSLLPLIAQQAQGGGSELYGLLMALIGAGAVTGALVLPRVQKAVSSDMTVRFGTGGTMLALVILALSSAPGALMLSALIGGFSWIVVLTSFNVSAQLALPDWVRARGLAVFLMVFFGSMALGSVLWGQIANASSVQVALLIATVGLGLGMVATRRFKVGQGETANLSPASIWPQAPDLSERQAPHQRAMVTVEYRIDPADCDAFLKALHGFATERLRNGATRWFIHESVEEPGTWVETFHLPSWAVHLEQHERVTQDDADLQRALRAFDLREDGPVVRHFVSPL